MMKSTLAVAAALAVVSGLAAPKPGPFKDIKVTLCEGKGEKCQVQEKKALDAIGGLLKAGDADTMQIRAVLGDYVRLMRLMRKDIVVNADSARAALLLGGIYLNDREIYVLGMNTYTEAANVVSKRDPKGRTALQLAIECKNETACKALLENAVANKYLPLDVDLAGNTVLHYAVMCGSAKTLDLLKQEFDRLAEGNAAAADNLKKLVNVANKDGDTPLILAARGEDGACLKKLIEIFNPACDVANARGETALIAAVKANRRAAVEELLGKGAEVDMKDVDGRTALDFACEAGQLDMIDLLLGKHAVLKGRLLTGAVARGDKEVIMKLLEWGADVNGEGVMAAAADPAVKALLKSQGGVD